MSALIRLDLPTLERPISAIWNPMKLFRPAALPALEMRSASRIFTSDGPGGAGGSITEFVVQVSDSVRDRVVRRGLCRLSRQIRR